MDVNKRKDSLVNLYFRVVQLNGKCGHPQTRYKRGKRRYFFDWTDHGFTVGHADFEMSVAAWFMRSDKQ